jgi:hypothetical protein
MSKSPSYQKHHDNHGPDASVPGKGSSTPKKHWEIRYSVSKGDQKPDPLHAFDPKCAKDRPTMHNKVNSTDH